MPEKPILAVDFGNVIHPFDDLRVAKALKPFYIGPGSEDTIYDLVYGPRNFPLRFNGKLALDTLPKHFEKGRISPAQFYQIGRVLYNLNDEISLKEYYEAFSNKFDYIPSTIAILKALKQAGYALVLFSNTSTWDYQRHMSVMVSELQFDGIITSYRIGAMKDSDDMYLHLKQKYEDNQIVYVDDIEKYVTKGLEHGIDAFQFHCMKDNPEVLVDALRCKGFEFENPDFNDSKMQGLIQKIVEHQVNPNLLI